jgi:hypothetical protein
MYRFYIDDRELRDAIYNFENIQEIDVEKEVTWYLNQVYSYLSKRHGTRYSYITPPGRERQNLRMRTRGLLNQLKASRFTKKEGDTYIAGWNIPEGNPRGEYLGVHVGIDAGEPPYHLTPSKAKYTFRYRNRNKILVPLRAGMNPDGTPKPISARHQIHIIQFRFIAHSRSFDWSGENTTKIHPHTLILYKNSGRRKIPMYMLFNNADIPKRMLLMPAMERYRSAFYDRIENQIEKELNRVTSQRSV